MTLPGNPNRVIGVYPHPKGGFQVCMVKDGQKIAEYRKSETAAQNRAAYWREAFGDSSGSDAGGVVGAPLPSGKAPREVVAYWEQKLREAAELVMESRGGEEAIAAANAVAKLAAVGVKIAEATPPGAGSQESEGPEIGPDVNVKKMSKTQLLELAEQLSQGALKKADV